MNRSLLALLFSPLFACSGNQVGIGDYFVVDGGRPPVASDAALTPDASESSPGSDASDGVLGPPMGSLEVRLAATTASVPHSDGLSGQTPVDQRMGILRLTLLRGANDPSPLVPFDHGHAPIEAPLNDGSSTVVGAASVAALAPGRYTVARVGVSHVRYRVNATMHFGQGSYPGEFANFQVLSNGVAIDGTGYNKGHYEFAFAVGGNTMGKQSGENGPLPQVPSSGLITLDTSGPISEYVFPIDLVIPDPLSAELPITMTLTLNLHENFRWEDEAGSGYKPGVFDTTPTGYEPVRTFGANSFVLSLN